MNYNLINDTILKYNGQIPGNLTFCKNYYSQNGEDGILEQLLKELKITSGNCCEFGASDGISSSNTYNLIKNYNFKGIAIESDKERYSQLKDNYKNHDVICINEIVTSENLPLFLKPFNYEFDILSIDIDSYDYDIWKNFHSHQPKIVIIEVNSYRDPVCYESHGSRTNDYSLENDPLVKWYNGRVGVGTSFIQMIELGLSKEYVPISFTGNIIFVHKKYIYNLKEITWILSENPYDYLYLYTHISLHNNEWYTNTGLIFNTIIKDYYISYKTKNIDFNWVFNRFNKKLTFSSLGKHGRLGNSMFQYAALKALSTHLNCEAVIPIDLESRVHHGQNCLLDSFKINCKRDSYIAKNNFTEHNMGKLYDPLFWNCQPDTDLFGHFESELYFEGKFDISEFELKENFQEFAMSLLKNIRQNNREIVGIHIRRGDSVDQNEITTTNDFNKTYLHDALFHFQNAIFLIFSGGSRNDTNDNSGDINWCKQNIKIENCYFSNCDTIHDFSLMVHCDHLILNSTSTIGWWAGYLNKNPNKKIIVPHQSRLTGSNYVKCQNYYSKKFIQV